MTDHDDPHPSRELPALRWLAIGAAAGLLAAAYGLLERSAANAPLPDNVVARVNDTEIGADRYQRSLDTLTASLGRAPDAEDRAQILERLIDEELLVQRGVDLGMAGSETTVRSAIVQSLIASVTAEADAADPSDDALERHLNENRERYTYASALAVDAWVADDERLAQDFVNRLRVDPATEADGDNVRRVPGLPEGPLPLERLRMFVGPAIAATSVGMPAGSSAVYARQGRWYVVRVNSHEKSALAELEAVRSQVLIDYRRKLADERLREYLDNLLRQADVEVSVPR